MFHGPAWWFFGMHFFWWLFWIGLIVAFALTLTPVPKRGATSGAWALEILRRRYAAGQISTDEYEKRKAVLERDTPNVAELSAHH